MCGCADVGHPLDLATLVHALHARGLRATYEPELYPGLHLKAEGLSMTVFRSGKLTLTGGTSPAALDGAIAALLPLFRAHAA